MKLCEMCDSQVHVRLLQLMKNGQLLHVCESCIPNMFNTGFRLLDYPNGSIIPWSMEEHWDWVVKVKEGRRHGIRSN